MSSYRISVVSYANTLPFVYGLTRCPEKVEMSLSFDYPAACADKLTGGQADIGLVPVASISKLEYYEIIPGFCLGATGKVRTVLLVSSVPLDQIKTVILDYQSRTSIVLARILAREYWKINVQWREGSGKEEGKALANGEARVLIGDRAFAAEQQYMYCYDLAEAWVKWTGLPFVFAAWIANKPILPSFIQAFNNCLAFGVKNIAEASRLPLDKLVISESMVYKYLTENISYPLDNSKMRGMNLFLEKSSKV